MRILDKIRSVFRFDELGMPRGHGRHLLARSSAVPFGMVLCAGPTGSGKTTTSTPPSATSTSPSRNIMTIEDPVEYVFPSINQIQTNEQAGLTFANGLKSILRQDPDVILVGEIRDVETARIAVQSALTGHLVLSSLHATDSASALYRFLDMGIEPFLIASSVIADHGPAAHPPHLPVLQGTLHPERRGAGVLRRSRRAAQVALLRGQGCNFCADTGYQDRIGVYELMRVTPEIKRLIVSCGDPGRLRRLARSQGMRTLSQRRHDAWSPTTSRPSPKSSERSTRCNRTYDAEIRLHRIDLRRRTQPSGVHHAASTPTHAALALAGRDIQPVSLVEKKSFLQFEITKKKVKRKDLMHFSRQLAAFLKAGIPLLEALNIINEEISDKLLPQASCQMITGLQSGDTFSDGRRRPP